MAAEVQVGSYLFRPLDVGIVDPLASDDDENEDGQESSAAPVVPPAVPGQATAATLTTAGTSLKRKRARKSDTADGAGYQDHPGQESDQPLIPFAYNPAHDSEALIWIGNYFIFNRRVVGHSQQQPQDHLLAQCAYARRLFSGNVDEKRAALDDIRRNEITKFQLYVARLHPALHEIGKQMKLWMQTMKAIYVSLEKRDCRTIASHEKALILRRVLAPFPARIIEILAREDIEVIDLPSDAKKIVEVQGDADGAVEAPAVAATELEVSDRPPPKRPNLNSQDPEIESAELRK